MGLVTLSLSGLHGWKWPIVNVPCSMHVLPVSTVMWVLSQSEDMHVVNCECECERGWATAALRQTAARRPVRGVPPPMAWRQLGYATLDWISGGKWMSRWIFWPVTPKTCACTNLSEVWLHMFIFTTFIHSCYVVLCIEMYRYKLIEKPLNLCQCRSNEKILAAKYVNSDCEHEELYETSWC